MTIRVNLTYNCVLHVSNKLLVLHLLLNKFELLLLELNCLLVFLQFNLILFPQLLDFISVFLQLQLNFLPDFINCVLNSLLLQIKLTLELKSSVFLSALLLLQPLVLGYSYFFYFDFTHFLSIFELSHFLSNFVFRLIKAFCLVSLEVCNCFVKCMLSFLKSNFVIYIQFLDLSCIVLIFTEHTL